MKIHDSKILTRQLLTFIVALIGTVAYSTSVNAQVSVTTLGVPYTQDFDTLPASGSATWTNNSTLPGWFHARTGTGTTIVANNGSSNAGNLYSYGTGTATHKRYTCDSQVVTVNDNIQNLNFTAQ